ncbi:MAG: hypothetical protein FJ297_08560 [Planctomycetes bacterium]|nr:hypothetical protein [Planctomycetota bacterium]
MAAVWTLLLGAALVPGTPVRAQTDVSPSESLSKDLQAKLQQKGTLILRDASLIEALFAIKENWGVNIVVGNDVKGAINGAFTDAPLHRILDAILAPAGYGYRAIGDGLVIQKLDEIGAMKPLFVTKMLPLEHVPPDEVVEVIKFMLSPNGKAHAVPSSKSIVVMDYADRIQLVEARLHELDDAARAAAERAKAEELKKAEEEARRQAALQARPASSPPASASESAGSDPSAPTTPPGAGAPGPDDSDPPAASGTRPATGGNRNANTSPGGGAGIPGLPPIDSPNPGAATDNGSTPPAPAPAFRVSPEAMAERARNFPIPPICSTRRSRTRRREASRERVRGRGGAREPPPPAIRPRTWMSCSFSPNTSARRRSPSRSERLSVNMARSRSSPTRTA